MPAGMLIPGIPAKLAGTVQISSKYIANGSLIFSPNLYAVLGAVGANSKSTLEKAASNSFLITRRTLRAFK